MARLKPANSWSELEEQFRNIDNQATTLFRGVDPAKVLRRPRPKSWNAVECLAHLNLSIDPYFSIWAREFEQAKTLPFSENQSHRLDFWGRVLTWTLEPRPRFRFPTSANFQPVTAGSPEQVLEEFLLRQRRVLDVFKQARGYAVDQINITSPFAASVRYSIWSSFCVTASHERRHLWQAQQALSA